jgi:signal transduction histidine kinase/CheY-like chemotaxis protein
VQNKVVDDPNSADVAALRSRLAELDQLLAARDAEAGAKSQQLEAAHEQLQCEHRRLHYTEDRLRRILEAALDAVLCFDTAGGIIEWNPQAELTLGWSREQALEQTVESLRLPLPRRAGASGPSTGSGPGGVSGSSGISGPSGISGHASSQGAWSDDLVLDQRVETTCIHRDGWDFPAELSVARLGSGSEAVFGVFLRDITVRKENEEDLAEARDNAVLTSRLKSEFLATMSHEIRSPMNGVLGMAELLLSTQLTPEQSNYAEAIQNSAEGLLAVIGDILDFSQMEIGQLSIESIPFDLQQVIEETVDLLAPRATQKDLDLKVEYAFDAPAALLGDPGRLRQVLTNVIGNAVKFTQLGQVAVHVHCEHSTETTARLKIAVEDTGIGIAADQLKHIFERFARADSSARRKQQGMGMRLGLPIAKRLVETMGGSLQVASQPGKGSRFEITIELPRDPQGAAARAPAASLAGMRVLIVDPSETSRNFVSAELGSSGVITGLAGGGEQALAAMRAAGQAGEPFDAVLIDYHLPDTEGESLALEIKSDPNFASTALIAFTSVSGQRYASRILLFGFVAIVVKPVRPSQLFRALAQARASLGDASGSAQDSGAGASSRAASATALCRARVLVAEDSRVNQKVVTRMLEKLGCAVDLAADGKQAAAMAEAVQYDLIFMDCHMPEMDGFEATAVIRSRQSTKRPPIVALTANAMDGDRERCLKAGMDDYLAKPIQVSDLTTTLQRWAPRRRQ